MKGSDFFLRLMFSVLLIGAAVLGVMLLLTQGVITQQIFQTGVLFAVVAGLCLFLSVLFAIWE